MVPRSKVEEFLEALGSVEEPFGMVYAEEAPENAVSPKQCVLPTVEDEAAGTVDWPALNAARACVIGILLRARTKGIPAAFDARRFGCLGGAFYLGYMKEQLDTIAHYVSSGIPGHLVNATSNPLKR
jgi:hypothetical protein